MFNETYQIENVHTKNTFKTIKIKILQNLKPNYRFIDYEHKYQHLQIEIT